MKRIALFFLMVILLPVPVSFAETQPAGDLSEGSRLVGLLITREDLSAHTDASGLLPAACVWEDPEGDPKYSFRDVDGLRLICFMMPEGTGGDSRMVSNVDDVFAAIHFDVDEDRGTVSMEAELRFAPGQEETLFFYNPVLLSASGQVYAVPGDFMAVSAGMNPPGSSVGQTIRDERTHREDGRETTDTTTITVQISAAGAPVEIRLVQFSAAHRLLKLEAFAPDAVPEQIEPLAEADYLLLETVEQSPDGTAFTRREVIGRDTDWLNTASCRDDGICLSHYHDVRWP